MDSLQRNIHEKTQEIWTLGQEKEQLLSRIQMLQNRLLQDAQLATQLKVRSWLQPWSARTRGSSSCGNARNAGHTPV